MNTFSEQESKLEVVFYDGDPGLTTGVVHCEELFNINSDVEVTKVGIIFHYFHYFTIKSFIYTKYP